MPRIRALAAATVALTLTACEAETTGTVYLSDIQKVAESGEAMAAPAVIALEMPAVSTCEEKGGAVVEILSPYLHEASNPRCEKAGMSARLVMDFKAPLVPDGSEFTGAAVFMVAPVEGAGIALFAGLNPNAINAVIQEAQNRHMPVSGTPDITMAVDLINDTGADAAVQISHVFLAGQAVPQVSTVTVRHREHALLTLSDVASAAAGEGRYVAVATLMTEDPATE